MAMKYVSAYLMVVLSGNENPGKKDIEKTLSSVGIETEGAVVDALLKGVQGKSAHQLIAEGMKKLQSVPTGAPAAAAPAAGGGGGAKAEAAPAKKEEKKEEEEEGR
ncbi:uncharacterized protein LOC131479206 [Ochotona princeps]|uniref:uncharacterized protein LOC131479206 n=1 Tax=Ochotona princeps TaxID=9978 RepID=UPI002714D7C0|nr:uncharacterized protein LOC131479206 [Ochotona princeps]